MLEVVDVRKSFGTTEALRGVSFEAEANRVTAIVGPSGCGKSTLLRIIAGLETPDAGAISWNGEDLADVPPHRRGFGLMFQDYALFPHLDVGDNVGFGPRVTGGDGVDAEVARSLALVGLEGFEHRKVESLSGGEQQRVALARTLASRPHVLMLDEPISALDRALREELLGELDSLLAELEAAVIYVTHDQGEALALADQLVVMAAGELRQVASPHEVWSEPADRWTAEFLSVGTVVEAPIVAGSVQLPEGELPSSADAAAEPVPVLLRADAFHTEGPLDGTVATVRFRGRETDVRIAGSAGTAFNLRMAGAVTLREGDHVTFGFHKRGVQRLKTRETRRR